MTLRALIRPNILSLSPYSSGKSEFSEEAEIYLDTNESPFENSILRVSVNRYPDPVHRALRKKFAKFRTVRPENIVFGNGSDELIDLLIRIFCEPKKDAIAYCPPTFGMYKVAACINNVKRIEINLDENWDISPKKILQEAKNAKIIFLCTPNNPTGNTMSTKNIEKILKNFSGIVVLDEAYIDFCPEKSFAAQLDEFPRLVILQTFSKAFGLAGIRLGAAMAHAEIIQYFLRIKPPYNVNALTAKIALEKIETGKIIEDVNILLSERKKLEKELFRLSLVDTIFPSDSNFLCVRFFNAQKIYEILLQEGIVVRNFSTIPQLKNCLRISIGTPEENKKLLSLLQKI